MGRVVSSCLVSLFLLATLLYSSIALEEMVAHSHRLCWAYAMWCDAERAGTVERTAGHHHHRWTDIFFIFLARSLIRWSAILLKDSFRTRNFLSSMHIVCAKAKKKKVSQFWAFKTSLEFLFCSLPLYYLIILYVIHSIFFLLFYGKIMSFLSFKMHLLRLHLLNEPRLYLFQPLLIAVYYTRCRSRITPLHCNNYRLSFIWTEALLSHTFKRLCLITIYVMHQQPQHPSPFTSSVTHMCDNKKNNESTPWNNDLVHWPVKFICQFRLHIKMQIKNRDKASFAIVKTVGNLGIEAKYAISAENYLFCSTSKSRMVWT